MIAVDLCNQSLVRRSVLKGLGPFYLSNLVAAIIEQVVIKY